MILNDMSYQARCSEHREFQGLGTGNEECGACRFIHWLLHVKRCVTIDLPDGTTLVFDRKWLNKQ